MNAQAEAWARSSREHYQKNLEFAKGMELHGQRVMVPCRSGERLALFHKATQPGLRPAIFEIYGGGFSQGYVANDDNLRTQMCDATGFHIIGLDYRKSVEHPYPAALEDVYDAVCYFSDNAEEFGIDRTRLAVWGHSAGANLACALSLLAKETGRFSLKAQLLDYPLVDGATPGIEKNKSSTGLTADAMDAMMDLYASPAERRSRYVSPILATKEELKGIAPTVMVICGIDALRAEAETMAGHFIEAGVPLLVRKFTEASHGFIEHWHFKEFYLDNMSPEERAGIPDGIGEMAEEGMRFLISAAKYLI